MRVKLCLIVAVALTCMLAGFSRAQEPQQQPQSPTQTSSGSSSMDIQGSKADLLGPGDVLDIRVFGQPDLSTNAAQIDSDGNLSSLPFLDKPIPARCRTDKDIQKDLTVAYTKLIKNPQVSVRVAERNSRQPATVFGAVRQSMRVEMKGRVGVDDLLEGTGGVIYGVGGSRT